MMRTNYIDATAFRCLSEFINYLNILSKTYSVDSVQVIVNPNKLIADYSILLASMETIKEIREAHSKAIKELITRIDNQLKHLADLSKMNLT